MLLCPEILGAGKTIFTSIVVDDLCNRFRNNTTVGIAYIYCNFRYQDKLKIESLLASLLKQLAESKPLLPGTMKDYYNYYKARRTRPLLEETLTVLQSLAAIYSRVFFIIDVLDECQVSDGYQARFLSELFNIQTQHGANIFATSRFILEIINQFKHSILLKICTSGEDIERYLEGYM